MSTISFEQWQVSVRQLDEAGLQAVLHQAQAESWTQLTLLGLPGLSTDWYLGKLWKAERDAARVFVLKSLIQVVPDALLACSCLTSLNLWENAISGAGARAIAEGLKGLTSLDLGWNSIDESGARAIAEGLKGLTSLDLGHSSIGDSGARAIAERLKDLTSLDLRSSSIGDSGARAIAEGLKGLTSLELRENSIGDSGARAIAEGLKGLTSLDLRHSSIGDCGARAIAERLKDLTSLDLRSSSIGDSGARALAVGLKGLTSLVLGGNNIGDSGARAIAEGLKGLTSLELGYNSIGDSGARAIAVGLKGLTSLVLGYNRIGDSGARAMLDVMARDADARPLVTLTLAGNRISSIPAELLYNDDAQSILAYWKKRSTGRRLDEVKLLILGQGGVGKTHLRRRLFEARPDYFEQEHLPTHNIVAVDQQIEAELDGQWVQVRARVWDFGGQPNLHASHRFFMSEQRCLYVLVLDTTRSEGENRLRTWLRTVRHHGGSKAPVIAVLAKCDEPPANGVDGLENTVGEAARDIGCNIVGVGRVGWKPPSGHESLDRTKADEKKQQHQEQLESLREMISRAIPHVVGLEDIRLSDPFFSVKAWMEDQFNAPADKAAKDSSEFKRITRDAYTDQCREAGLDPAIDDGTLAILRALGVVHFIDADIRAPGAEDTRKLLFNPQWVKGPTYTLVRAEQFHRHGVVPARKLDDAINPEAPHADRDEEDGRSLWRRLSFDTIDRQQVVTLMRASELAFGVHQAGDLTDDLLVPDLLPDRSAVMPAPGVASGGTVCFEHLPESVLLRLIGRWHDRLVAPNECWRSEVTFFDQRGGLRARLTADTEACTIDVAIWKQPHSTPSADAKRPLVEDARYFYRVILEELREIAQSGGLKEQTVKETPLKNVEQATSSEEKPERPALPSLGRVTGFMGVILFGIAFLVAVLSFAWWVTKGNLWGFGLLTAVLIILDVVVVAFVAAVTGITRGTQLHDILVRALSKVPGLGTFVRSGGTPLPEDPSGSSD